MLRYLINLHITIAALYLDTKIMPHVERRHALSLAVNSHESSDVNLKLFEVLGRLAQTGHWMLWANTFGGREIAPGVLDALRKLVSGGMQLINNNPCLFLPLMDAQAIEVALFLSLAKQTGHVDRDIAAWLSEMVKRLRLATLGHGKYPSNISDYHELLEHPKSATDEYRKEVTAGSVLIPLLMAFVAALRDAESIASLTELKTSVLDHCTLQLWLPDSESEAHFYLNDEVHGIALTDLPISRDGQDLIDLVTEACETSTDFTGLSAANTGYYPIILTACRHYRLPVPPQFWIGGSASADGRDRGVKVLSP